MLVENQRIGRFAASKRIAFESWNVLKQDKEMLWFPVLSALLNLVAFGIVLGIAFVTIFDGSWAALENIDHIVSDYSTNPLAYACLLVWYVVTYFIVNFFQAGVFIIAHARFNGRDLGFWDGLAGALSHTGGIFLWSLISATVGVALQALADRFKFVGAIVSSLLGAAWAILTYFSLLSLVIGNTSVLGAFKESASVIRKTWGETIIVHLGAGFFFAGLLVLGVITWILLALLVGNFYLIVGLFVLLVVYAMLIVVVSTTLGAIFKLVLYEYERSGKVPSGFSPELVQNAVRAASPKTSIISGIVQ
jgi:hypothetical protein